MTEKEKITVDSNITGHEFARFAMVDTFVRKKAWRSPALFALMMGAFSLVCFTLARDKEQSALLGTVLLSVGLVLPTVWLLMYIFSVRKQIKKFGLSTYKIQYSTQFGDDGFRVTKGKETADFGWDDVTVLIEDKGCAYLYVDKGRAFLLPDSEKCRQALKLAEKKLPPEKLKKRRNNKSAVI